jgi:hypothetical protein
MIIELGGWMTQRDEGHDYRDSKNKAQAYERKQEEILNSFQAWLEKCPVDYDEHLQTSDDDITSINFHYKNIWNRKHK